MIPEYTLDHISRTIVEKLGLDFPSNKRNDLKRGILNAAADLGFQAKSPEYIAWLEGGEFTAAQLEVFAMHLTVGETYFFREDSSLQIFREIILPSLIEKRKHFTRSLRIWSAGCCSGEEAYTIAIILKEMIPDIANWSITILGTDLNPKFLKKASLGRYTTWSFRETPEVMKKHYFTPVGKEFEIIPEIRKMVRFSLLNLVDDVYPDVKTNTTDMDVIFCRNVLMYFTPEQIKTCGKRFYKSLTSEGWFITSAVELSDDLFPQFHKVNAFQTVVYQKSAKNAEAVNLNFATAFEPPSWQQNSDVPTESPAAPEILPFFFVPEEPQVDAIIQEPATTFSGSALHEPPATKEKAKQVFEAGQYDQCIQLILEMPDHERSLPDNMHLLIRSCANTGKLHDSRKHAETLIDQDKLNADHYHLYAMVLMEMDDVENAAASLKKAIYLSPGHLMANYMLGNIEQRQGRQPQARKLFRQVAKMLDHMEDDELVPGSEGMTAGRMRQLVKLYL